MQQSDWLQSIAQNLAANAIWYVGGLAYAISMAILKKKHSSWFTPLLYGLMGGVLVAIIAIAGNVSTRWPRGGPAVLVAVVLGTVVTHIVIARAEREAATAAQPKADHQECENKINYLKGRIHSLEDAKRTAELVTGIRQSDLDTAKQELFKERQDALELSGKMSDLARNLDVFSVPNGQFQIMEALFFFPGREANGLDITAQLISQVGAHEQGVLWLGMDRLYHEEFRPDPQPGDAKRVRVSYLHRGNHFSVVFPENARIRLPLPYKMIERDRSRGLVIRY